VKNILTIDLEDSYHGTQFDNRSAWAASAAQGCIIDGTARILDLLRTQQVRATFFVLGLVAEQHPALIRAIAAAGHELAAHGWSHRRLWLLTPDEFRDELTRTDAAISAALGRPHRSRGFRAPFFTLDRRSEWALDVMRDYGMHYDCSSFPIVNYLGGAPGWPRFPHDRCGLREIPVSTLRCAGLNLPFSGGLYLRCWPYPVVAHGIRACNRAGRPAIVYLHPREVVPEQARLTMSWWQAATYYYKLDAMLPKLARLVREFPFGSVTEVRP